MDEVSDEVLMAYVDGELTGAERERVAAAIANDAELAERARKLEAMGLPLREPFDDVLREPVPKHLIDLVMGVDSKEPAKVVPLSSRRADMGGTDNSRPHRFAPLRIAAGIALLVVAGNGAWLLQHRSSSWLDGSSAALQRALERMPSGTDIALSVPGDQRGRVRAVSTFIDQGERYCREYEITRGSDTFVGFACRTGPADWVVEQQARQSAGAEAPKYLRTAKKKVGSAVAAGIEEASKGGVFDPQEEQLLLGSGWSARLPPR